MLFFFVCLFFEILAVFKVRMFLLNDKNGLGFCYLINYAVLKECYPPPPGSPPVSDHRKRPNMGFKTINKLLTGCSALLVNTVKSNTYTRDARPSESSIFTCTKIFSVIFTLKQIIHILDQVNGFP